MRSSMSHDKAVTVLVTGDVQGVGFRWWTRHRLEDLGLHGTATNLPDGRVRVEARGPAAAVDSLVVAIRGGQAPGTVTGVEVVDTPTAAQGDP